MPPKQSTSSARGRGTSTTVGRSSKPNNAASKTQASTSASSRARSQPSRPPQAINSDASDADPFAEDMQSQRRRGEVRSQDTMEIDDDEREEEEEESRKTIPPELLTHILHQFFEKDGTRVSKDANAAIAKYMDIFVREAIARTVVEKEKGFLEVSYLGLGW
ncbi:CENP-S associating centromere protein X-domain-containing protein [Hypoxylon sp. NC0597]|nr:CENP-S associating centromere protein X-domain-containing protein [Hypoxylon sp. NC0597]